MVADVGVDNVVAAVVGDGVNGAGFFAGVAADADLGVDEVLLDVFCFCCCVHFFASAYFLACRDRAGAFVVTGPGRRVIFFCRARREVTKAKALNTYLCGAPAQRS